MVVEDVKTARIALERLGASEASGSVLAIKSPYVAMKRPESEDLLRRRVTGKTPQLDPLLDSLLANAICVAGGWSEAMDLAEQHPGLTVVTASGHCCGPNGWSVRSGDNASTITALEDARDQVQVATARREAAEVEREVAESRQRDTQTRFSEALSHLEGNDLSLIHI